MVIQDNLINKNGDVGLGTTEFRAGFMAMKFTVEHDDQPWLFDWAHHFATYNIQPSNWKPARNHRLEGEDDLSIIVDITVYTTVLLDNNG